MHVHQNDRGRAIDEVTIHQSFEYQFAIYTYYKTAAFVRRLIYFKHATRIHTRQCMNWIWMIINNMYTFK